MIYDIKSVISILQKTRYHIGIDPIEFVIQQTDRHFTLLDSYIHFEAQVGRIGHARLIVSAMIELKLGLLPVRPGACIGEWGIKIM